MIHFATSYESVHGQAVCVGRQVTNEEEFTAFLKGPVSDRLHDTQHEIDLEADLRDLSTTDMAVETLKRLLSSEPAREPWEVGETLAECLLTVEHGAEWPWNVERDKRTPKASLPGADLVGFVTEGDEVYLLFGEVKTSSEKRYPPQAMCGRRGMVHQIDALAVEPQLHRSLFKWLHARCKDTPLWPKFQAAATHYLHSGGKGISLFGILIRDVGPDERDLRNRGLSLGRTVAHPTRVHLHAWYIPCLIDKLPALIGEGAA